MNAVLRRRFEMAERVRDFLRAHRTEGDEATLGRLEQLLERVGVLALQQRAGIAAMRASTAWRAGVRRELQSTLLLYLSRVASLAARKDPGIAVAFKLPRVRIPDLAFLGMARGMLEKATELRELFASEGMSDRLLGALAEAIAEFDRTLEASRAARREQVGATADLWAVSAQISLRMRVLDGLVRYRFWDQADLRAAWLAVRKVGGPRRAKGETEAVVGEILQSRSLATRAARARSGSQSGRRDLNSTAPMRGRCFIGTYVRQPTALVRIGRHGPANITANIFCDYDDSRLAVQRSGLFLNRLVRRLAQCLQDLSAL